MGPNVLLIVLDTARADALEPYGAPAGASPVIADLARRGTAVQGRATACWTVPSHASIFTGLMPRAAGLARAPGGTPHGCRPVLEAQRERLLAEVMRRAGYETRGITTNLWLTEASGFATGFETFEEVETDRQGKLHADSLRDRVAWAGEALRARADDGAARAAAILERWAGERRERPFFWFVNLVECHSPYLPPKPYNDLGPIERLRAAEDARRYLTLGAIWQACAGGLEVPHEALERMRHLYASAVRVLDDWVGRALESLDANGLLDETLVIVCSDHGENFGDQGLMGHAFSLDERLTRVPLVVAGPGAPESDAPLSLAAIPRVAAQAAGVVGHPYGEGAPAPGIGLAQFDPPAPRDDPRWNEALRAWGLGEEVKDRLAEPLAAATDGRWKLVVQGASERLFDLRSDSLEEHALPLDSDPDAVGRLREALGAELAVRPATPGAAANEDAAQPSPEELRELEERMKLLGYM